MARRPIQQRPSGVERDYARALLRVTDLTKDALVPLRIELPSLLVSARKEVIRQDCALHQDAGESRRVMQLIRKALSATRLTPRSMTSLANRSALGTKRHQRAQMKKTTQAVFGVDVFKGDGDLATATEFYVAENVALIKDLSEKTLKEIEGEVLRGVSRGALHKDIAKSISNRLGIQRNRAKLIARDQVGKYYGEVNAHRHKAIGVEEFKWHTVGDERVRTEHAALHGRKFSYAHLPSEGLPGTPILCRCFADPVFDALF